MLLVPYIIECGSTLCRDGTDDDLYVHWYRNEAPVSQSAFFSLLLPLATYSGIVQGEHSSTAAGAVQAMIFDNFVSGEELAFNITHTHQSV